MMWCTRWFLPLILLPLPTAPPYLLLLFLFSLTMHARPCFYCIVLLTALFLSSCYWQPLPINSPLSTPWSVNITTFSEALSAIVPSQEHDYLSNGGNNRNNKWPTVIRLIDRCWCDFSSGSFFEPYNVSEWEFASVMRLKNDLAMDRERGRASQRERELKKDAEPERNGEITGFAAPTPPPAPRPNPSTTSEKEEKGAFGVIRSAFWRAPSKAHRLPDPPSSSSAETSPPEEARQVAHGEFDLQPYGFDLVLDFRWTRQPS